jgi:hypothetical protein
MAYADLRCIPSHYRLTYLITFDENSAAIPQLNEWRWLEKQTKASGDLTTRATSDLATAKVEKPVAICTPEPAAICTHYLDLGVEGGAIVGRTNVVRPCRLRLHCRRGGVKCSVPSLRQPELPETSIAPSAPHCGQFIGQNRGQNHKDEATSSGYAATRRTDSLASIRTHPWITFAINALFRVCFQVRNRAGGWQPPVIAASARSAENTGRYVASFG